MRYVRCGTKTKTRGGSLHLVMQLLQRLRFSLTLRQSLGEERHLGLLHVHFGALLVQAVAVRLQLLLFDVDCGANVLRVPLQRHVKRMGPRHSRTAGQDERNIGHLSL